MTPIARDKIDALLTLHTRITAAARDLMLRKNHDYTSGSVDPLANFRYAELLNVPLRRGILIRIFDKIKRLVTFIEVGIALVCTEKVEDTVIDAINYLVLWLYSYQEDKGDKQRQRNYTAKIIDHLLSLNLYR